MSLGFVNIILLIVLVVTAAVFQIALFAWLLVLAAPYSEGG